MAIQQFGMTMEGISEADLIAAREQLRPALERAMRSPLKELRKRMVDDVSGVKLNIKSGKTRRALRAARIKTSTKGEQVIGTLSHRGFLLNIFEGGATLPAMTVRPRNSGGFLKFGGIYAKKVELPVRHIAARPITRPAMSAIEPLVRLKLAATVERVIAEGRAYRQEVADATD